MAPWIGNEDADPKSVKKGIFMPKHTQWNTPVGEMAVDVALVNQISLVARESSNVFMAIQDKTPPPGGEGKPTVDVLQPTPVLFEASDEEESKEWAIELQLPVLKCIADDLGITIKIVPM